MSVYIYWPFGYSLLMIRRFESCAHFSVDVCVRTDWELFKYKPLFGSMCYKYFFLLYGLLFLTLNDVL